MSQFLSLAAAEPPADFEQASILFVGAATVVLRYGDFTVLVDPRFLHHGDHVHLGYDLTASGLGNGVEPLPPVDFVLVPRLQDGHPGRAVDHELDRRLPVLATRRAASTLRQKGFVAARGLAAWESIRVERAETAVRVTSVPAPHPPSFESFLPDAMGAMLEFAGPEQAVRLRAFVSGESVVHGDLREMSRRHPGVDVVLFPVGGKRVLGVLAPATEERTAGVRLVAPRIAPTIPSDEGVFESTLEDFVAAARRAGLEARVEYVDPRDGYVFRPAALRAGAEEPPVASSDAPAEALGAPDGDRPVAA